MFVSHKLSPKKTFQKPNILRRKTKVSTIRSTCKASAPPVAAEPKPSEGTLKIVQLEVLSQDIACSPTHSTSVAGIQDVHTAAVNIQDLEDIQDKETVVVETSLVDEVQHSTEQEVVDVEAFLNGSQTTQYKTEYKDQTKLEDIAVHKWQIDFENATDKIILEPYEGFQVLSEDKLDAELQPLAVDYDHLTIRPGKFKCDEPECNKVFLTEQKLRRHRAVHNKRAPAAAPAPAAVECPAGAGAGAGPAGEGAGGEGAGPRCGRVFAARDLLARHLQEDHAPEDALHACGECGRRFFWAVGLRAHARAHESRGALYACLWPGCGRTFRQPCRLREHARAHTGDRPYRCMQAPGLPLGLPHGVQAAAARAPAHGRAAPRVRVRARLPPPRAPARAPGAPPAQAPYRREPRQTENVPCTADAGRTAAPRARRRAPAPARAPRLTRGRRRVHGAVGAAGDRDGLGGGGGGDGDGGGARGAHALHVAVGAARRRQRDGGAGVLRAQRPVPRRARRRQPTNDRGRGERGAGAGGRLAARPGPAGPHAGGVDVHGRSRRVLLPSVAAQRGTRLVRETTISRHCSPLSTVGLNPNWKVGTSCTPVYLPSLVIFKQFSRLSKVSNNLLFPRMTNCNCTLASAVSRQVA